MKIVELLPEYFCELKLNEQVDRMIDAYSMALKMSGNKELMNNINMLQLVKKEMMIREFPICNIFDMMGNEITKENFREIKSKSLLS